jgi:DNA-binding NtrC family response regulator
VPALNERTEDIPLLSQHFIEDISTGMGKKMPHFTDEALEKLKSLPWTGNIRELRNVVERLTILCDEEITAADVKRLA